LGKSSLQRHRRRLDSDSVTDRSRTWAKPPAEKVMGKSAASKLIVDSTKFRHDLNVLFEKLVDNLAQLFERKAKNVPENKSDEQNYN
jgi:hypothetical protein